MDYDEKFFALFEADLKEFSARVMKEHMHEILDKKKSRGRKPAKPIKKVVKQNTNKKQDSQIDILYN
jgi:hypothetical protein